MRYNIVLKDNKDFILASCKTLEEAERYLDDMAQTDKKLKTYYNWAKTPEYIIIKEVNKYVK